MCAFSEADRADWIATIMMAQEKEKAQRRMSSNSDLRRLSQAEVRSP